MELVRHVVYDIVRHALQEDVGHGDITTLSAIPPQAEAKASMVAKESGVIAGLPVVEAVFDVVDSSLSVEPLVADGDRVEVGTKIASIQGNARAILTGERVALNFIQRLSGIATLTNRYVQAIAGLPVRILDTRKTTPGLRMFEKYAVCSGGGVNHRYGLYDGVMLKDNHLALLASQGYTLREAVQRIREQVGPLVRIEVEVEDIAQAMVAVEAGTDVILLDNMSPATMREAVAAVAGRAILEASGGITLDTIRAVAETGIDYISVGALTHSFMSLDVSLDFEPV